MVSPQCGFSNDIYGEYSHWKTYYISINDMVCPQYDLSNGTEVETLLEKLYYIWY